MPDDPVVFNIVITGQVFWHLRYFVCSILHNSDASVRFVANGCSPATIELLEQYSAHHPDRVVATVEVSDDRIVAHGVALDAVRAVVDDGPLFAFVDPDIKARAPYLHHFRNALATHAAVTSGQEVWTDENVVPASHLGVGLGGRHFYHPNGFVYGCPHLALYRRDALEETCARWGIGLGTAGPDLPDRTRARLEELGHLYRVYDTGKVVNIMLQSDGHTFCHIDPPELLHIGGMSHFLSPPDALGRSGEDETPSWARYAGMEARLEVARYTAAVLRHAVERRPLPALPSGLEPSMERRLRMVRDEVVDLVDRYRECSDSPS